MFHSSAGSSISDSRLEQILREVSHEVIGPEEDIDGLDFAIIEQRAHEVGRRVARRLAEQAVAKQAENARDPQPCPDCRRLCDGAVATRELTTRDGPIQLREAVHHRSRCRRAFFPQ